MTELTAENITVLRQKYESLKQEQPHLRIRNAAKMLDCSECELVALYVGENNTRLEGDWKEFLKEVKSLGRVMALTRNDDVVHEKHGVYNNVSFNDHVGLVLDPEIDLRLFMSQWVYGFSVKEPFQGSFRRSFQFFDKFGNAIHKIYATGETNMEAYDALENRYRAAEQISGIQVEKAEKQPVREMPDAMVDVENFRNDWKNLKDTHDFYMLFGKYRINRVQALRLAPEGMAILQDKNILRRVMDAAAERQVPIMVFVGNKGCIQIHTGEIHKVAEHQNWYNVLDEGFNLHVNEDSIHSAWIVKKPTLDGIVTAIEIYDDQNELMVQFFGKRKPGVPEDEQWRKLVEEITRA